MSKLNETNDCSKQTVSDSQQLGLCSTCNDMKICVSKKTWKGPVFFCEEFNDYVPSEIDGKKPEATPSVSEDSASRGEGVAARRLGLCVNCLHIESCTFPIVESGVWHCEEYE